jgi:hypothetical protein
MKADRLLISAATAISMAGVKTSMTGDSEHERSIIVPCSFLLQ